MMKFWERGRNLGGGSFGFVCQARPLPGHPLARFFPSVMAVKSAKALESSSLHWEKQLFTIFRGCPHILRCFGSDITVEDDNQPFYNLFLEYASGGSLADRLHAAGGGGGVPEEEVSEYAESVLMGLRYVHGKGYVHCDIKPDNILIVEEKGGERKAKIADLGLAMKAGKFPGKVRGTGMYMAPESICHGEYGTWADIWAMGCTLLELITGKKPWPKETMYSFAFTDQVPHIPSGLSWEAQDFFEKCLVRDPKSRWTADMLLRHPFIQGSYDEYSPKLGKLLPHSLMIEVGFDPEDTFRYSAADPAHRDQTNKKVPLKSILPHLIMFDPNNTLKTCAFADAGNHYQTKKVCPPAPAPPLKGFLPPHGMIRKAAYL